MTGKTAPFGIFSARGATAEAMALGLCFGLLPLLPLVAPQGAHILVPLAVLGAARMPQLSRPVLVATAAFLAWAALSAIWTGPPGAWQRWFGQTAIEIPFGLVLIALAAGASEEVVKRAGIALAIGVGLTAGLVLFNFRTDGSLHELVRPGEPWQAYAMNRPLVVACLLCWPAAAALHDAGRRVPAAAIIVAPGLVALAGASGTALLAMATGAVILAAARILPRVTAWLLAVGGAAGILLAPVIAVDGFALLTDTLVSQFNPLSVLARLQIWHAAGEMIYDAPLLGEGMGAIRAVTIPELAWLFADQKVTHPHNAALQAWLDLGVVGAGFLVAAHLAAIRLAGTRPLHLATVGAVTAALMTSWNLWAAWWLATIAGVLAAMALGTRRHPAA